VKNENVVQPRGKGTPYIQDNTVSSHTQNTMNFLPEYPLILQQLQMITLSPTTNLSTRHATDRIPILTTEYCFLLAAISKLRCQSIPPSVINNGNYLHAAPLNHSQGTAGDNAQSEARAQCDHLTDCCTTCIQTENIKS